MKTSPTRFLRLATALLAMMLSLGSALAEILIEDDFTNSASGASAPASITNRKPTKGPAWEGTARMEEGSGLIANEAQPNSSAFADVNVPPEFKKVTVKIRYRRGSQQQFAFGFANSDKALHDDTGKNNQGLMWVNTFGKRANMIAGKYSNGEKVENLAIPNSSKNLEAVEMTFEVENPGNGAWVARLVANEKELAAKEIKPTETPTFRYFFIQFRGDDGKFSDAKVEKVSVEFE